MVINATTDDTIKDSSDLVLKLREGVTAWAKETEEGKSLYEYAGDDMNIGDIADYLDEIVPFCKGIDSIEAESIDSATDWVFDSQLCENLEEE